MRFRCACLEADLPLQCPKLGHGGVHIEYRVNNGVWTFVAVDTDKPYVHDQQLLVANVAEMREYRMRFWDKGEPNGDWTPVQRVAIGT